MICITICLLILSCSSYSIAGDNNAGTRGGQFLKIDVGARACGMGGAYVAVAEDVNTIYWNPAALAKLTHQEITFMHNEWLDDTGYEFLAYARPLSDKEEGIGISITYLGCGNIEGYENKDKRVDFSACDLAVTAGYGKKINKLFIGGNIKGIYQKIKDNTATGMAMDIGILYDINNIRVGACIQNIGTKLKFDKVADSLPVTIRTGTAFTLLDDRILISMDITKPVDNDIRINMGIEYKIMERVMIRCGYNSDNDLDDGLSAGIGFVTSRSAGWYFDYAFVPYGDIGNTHRVSVRKQW
jgi:hypothetical protein